MSSGPVDGVGPQVILKDHRHASRYSVDDSFASEFSASGDGGVEAVIAHQAGHCLRGISVEGITQNLLDLPVGCGDVENRWRRKGLVHRQRYGGRDTGQDGDTGRRGAPPPS